MALKFAPTNHMHHQLRFTLTESTKRLYFSTALTVFLFFLSLFLLLARKLLNDPDTLWHLRNGQWILDHAKFPTVDFYSYTAVGARWISVEWLSDIFFALAYKIGAWRGVVILSSILCAAIIATASLYLLRKLRFSVAIGLTAIMAFAISPHFLARPHLFSYLLILVWLTILLDSYDAEDFRLPIPLLCALMILWANLHSSFTLGLVVLYIFSGFHLYEKFVQRDYAPCKRLFFNVLLITVCAFATPYGVYSALFTLETFGRKYMLEHIQEWHSPDFQNLRFHLFVLVGILASIAGFGIQMRGPRLVIFAMLLVLGLSYTRGLTSFFLLTPILLAKPISDHIAWCSLHADVPNPVLLYIKKRAIMIPMIFLGIAILGAASSWHDLGIGPPESVAPKAAVNFTRTAGIKGNVFNSYGFGGYLIFSGIPTFIDGRIPPYSGDFVRRTFEAIDLVDINDAFRLLDEYKVNWILLRPQEPLTKALARSPRWDGVYSDKYSVVFVRRR